MRFNEVTQQLSEDFDPIKRQHLDDLISQYRDATDPIGYDDDAPDPDEVIAQIRQEFGDKIADDLEQGPSSHFPRDNHSMGYDSLKHSGSPRVTKSGKVNRQDVSALKSRLQQRAGSHTEPTLPEGVAEGSQRVDSLVTDALKIMRGPELADAVQALKTVLGDREFSSRRGHYNFFIRQMMDMYGQQGVAEGTLPESEEEKKSFKVSYHNPKTRQDKVVKIKADNKDEVLDYCANKGYKDAHVEEMASEGYRVVPGYDKEKYQERPGLEGPFHTKSGKVVYYDKKEGSYYDPDTDMFISYEDWQAMNEAGFNRRPSGRDSWDSNMPGYQGDYGGADNWGRREREDDEHHEIDRRQEQQAASGTWYITKDGKLVRDKEGQPYQFVGKAAATKAAQTMMAKPFNQGKKFMLTTKGA